MPSQRRRARPFAGCRLPCFFLDRDRFGFLWLPRIDSAILPISVCIPVNTTMPRPRPLATIDEEYAIFRRSPTPHSSSLLEEKSILGSFATGKAGSVSSVPGT